MKRHHKPTAIAAIIIAITFALAACGTATQDAESASSADCVGLDDGYESCTVTLPDTRRVQCLYRKVGYSGGLECDWSHMDGADNL